MRNVKLLNRYVWALNFLLVAGIVVFSFRYLLRASDNSLIKDIKPDNESPRRPGKPRDDSDGSLKTLTNPIQTPNINGPEFADSPFKAVLKGTLPSEKEPKRGIAFIKSIARNTELVAYVDENILQEGKPYEEFLGWTMAAVGKDRAVFTNKTGQLLELTIDPAVTLPPGSAAPPASGLPAAAGTSRISQAYTSQGFKSRLLASTDTRQVWGMDQDELDWAAKNADQIMDRDFRVAPYAGGGLRVEGVNAGSIGAVRGLMAGDVLREVNGQPLNNIADVRSLMSNSAIAQQPGLRLTIERAGKPFVIEYRPLPK